MLLLECENIKKYYGDRTILDIKSFKVYSEDRIGIVGLNGAGKTTLLNILCGKLEPDEGFVRSYGSYSYISQLEEAEYKELNMEQASKFGISSEWKDYMSGGEKTRFKLAQSLNSNSQLIFADEPTSNLDMEAVQLIEGKFKAHSGALVLISHDRSFLDSLCNKIIELDQGKLKLYNGNYSEYKYQKDLERERAQFQYEEYVREKGRLEGAMEETRHKVRTMRKAPARMGNSEARLHKMGNQKAKANLDRAVKNLQARVDHLEVKERPKKIEKIALDALYTSNSHSRILISGKDINKSFSKETIFKNADFNIYNGSKTALLGPNGSGKSTLLKMIMNRDISLNISPTVKIGYFSQSLDILDEDLSILQNVLRDSIYDENFARILLARLLFKGEDINKKVKVLSGGEKVKASFAKIFLQDINLLILDEPTNYLDIYSMEAVEEALRDYPRTLLFVSHDRRFVSSVADHILAIEDKKLTTFTGTFQEYMENIKNKSSSSNQDKQNIEKRILLLENRLSELISRLSMPSKKDDIQKLDKEYYEVLSELKCLRNSR